MRVLFIPIEFQSNINPSINHVEFQGQPLWRHTLSRFSGFKLFVDTDSPQLIESIQHDANLSHVIPYLRDPDLIDPHTSVDNLISYFLDYSRIRHEPVGQIHVTFPFLQSTTVEKGFDFLKMNSPYDAVIGANRVRARFWREEAFGYVPVNHHPLKLQRTHRMVPYMEENSTFYLFNAEVFRKTKTRSGVNPHFMEVGFPENLDYHVLERMDTLISELNNSPNQDI